MNLLPTIAALLLAVPGVTAQSHGCLPVDDQALDLREWAETLVGDSALAEERVLWQVAIVPPAEVQIVQDPEVCSLAANVYGAGLQEDPRDVYVVRVGTRYIVWDPQERVGEFGTHIVFDLDWNLLVAVAT